MNMSPDTLDLTTFVLIDPTARDGETSLGLLDPEDTHTSLVVLLPGRSSSSALNAFADAENIDISTAASIYADQVAARIAGPDRVVETIVAGGSDAAVEIARLAAAHPTRRVLIPSSLRRSQPSAYRRLTHARSGFIVNAASNEASRTARPHRWSAKRRATAGKHINAALRDSAFADQLPASEVRRLDRLSTIVDVPAQTEVIRQGTTGRECLIVVDGTLTVERDGVVLADLGAGRIAGEIAMLTGQPRNANVVASSDATLLAMNTSEFATMLDTCPEFASQVLKTAVTRMAEAA